MNVFPIKRAIPVQQQELFTVADRPKLDPFAEGLRLRKEALDKLESLEWTQAAVQWCQLYIARHGEVMCDDVWENFPPPEGVNPNAMGAVLNGRNFKRLGYTHTKRKKGHARVVAIWGAKT